MQLTPIPSQELFPVFEEPEVYTIEDYYPQFNGRAPKSEERKLFRVREIFNDRREERPRAVVSTSLYFGTNHPAEFDRIEPTMERVREIQPFIKSGNKSWWEAYFQPFLDGCRDALPEGYVHRVYIARNLDFVIPLIPKHVEVYLMEGDSWGPVPGTFWRYLPLEEDVLCVARDADAFRLPPEYVHLLEFALATNVRLVRRVQNNIVGVRNRFGYRSIRGTFAAHGRLPFEISVSAWLELNRRERLGREIPGYPDLYHWGIEGPNVYGQDEQFLCRWLYYRMAHRPTIALLRPRSDLTFFRKDLAYLESRGPRHTAIRM